MNFVLSSATTCPALPGIDHSASIHCVNDYFDDVSQACTGDTCLWNTRCQVTCQDGYAVPTHMSSLVICDSDGEWDSLIPRCAGTEVVDVR